MSKVVKKQGITHCNSTDYTYYRPLSILREGNVSNRVCLSTGVGGVSM